MSNEQLVENDEKQLNYLQQIEAAALKIVSNPSKHINKKITRWALKVSSKSFIAQHRIDLQWILKSFINSNWTFPRYEKKSLAKINKKYFDDYGNDLERY